MSAITMNVSEFATKVAEVIANLKRDEELILTGDQNQVVAKLTPLNGQADESLAATPKHRQLGLTEGPARMSPDFNEPLAEFQELAPEMPKAKRRRAGTAEGTFWMSPDFNEPLEEFKEYME